MRARTARGRAKIDEAKEALKTVLTAIPAGTTVSFWIFSQVPVGPDPLENDPIVSEPERTIFQLWKPAPWNPAQSQELIGKLDQFKPFCETPLVQAMWAAANTDLKNARGVKTLLVLTDGADTRFKKNLAFNPMQNTIPQFLKTYLNRFGARINLVFFTAALEKPEELARAKADFEIPLKTLDPPGSFIAADDFDQLLRSLRQGIRQKLTCQILRPDGTPVSEDLLEVTGPGEEDKWWTAGLEPGFYKIRIQADRKYEQEIDLKRGDRLVIKLVDANGLIGFERALYSDDFGIRVEDEREGWRLAGLSSSLQRRGDLDRVQLLASLEEKPIAGGARAAIEQVYPGMAWFKLDGQGIDNPENQFTAVWRHRASTSRQSGRLMSPSGREIQRVA